MSKHLLCSYHDVKSPQDSTKHDANDSRKIFMGEEVWVEVHESTVENCWRVADKKIELILHIFYLNFLLYILYVEIKN